jgi:hypothetical protein
MNVESNILPESRMPSFSRELIKLKMQHSLSQECVNNILNLFISHLSNSNCNSNNNNNNNNENNNNNNISDHHDLPHDYLEVSTSAYKREWDFEKIDICASCWNHHYRKVNNDTSYTRTCPKCHWPRYIEDLNYVYSKLKRNKNKNKKSDNEQVKDIKLPRLSPDQKMTPRAVFRYIPLERRIKALFSRHRGFCQAVRDGYNKWQRRLQAREAVDNGTQTDEDTDVLQYVTDIHDSEVWDDAMKFINNIHNDPRNLIFGLCADSAELHAYGRSAKIKPILLTNFGIRHRIRCKSKYLWMVGIPPKEHKKIDPFLGNTI